MRAKEGFTLIELMFVISIIAMLSSIIVASLRVTRARARDAIRLESLRQIGVALSEYYDDHGHYPLMGTQQIGSWCNWTQSPSWTAECTDGGTGQSGTFDLNSDLAPYMKKLPVDPASNNGFLNYSCCDIAYFVNSDGTDYDLIAILETDDPNRCEIKQWISHTGGHINGINSPGIGNTWCDPNNFEVQVFPANKYIVSDH